MTVFLRRGLDIIKEDCTPEKGTKYYKGGLYPLGGD
jgi:hypothetical protein